MNSKNNLHKGGFLYATLVLVSGTTVGHGITALAMPLLARLYTPEDFGLLAVFTAIVTTIGVAGCLRFDIAIAIPKLDEDGMGLLLLSFAVASIVTLIVIILVFIGYDYLTEWIYKPGLDELKWLVPVGVFVISIWSALQNWQIRKQNFSLMAFNRASQSLTTVGFQSATAFVGLGPFGLVAGSPAGFTISIVWYLKRTFSDIKKWFKSGSIPKLKKLAVEYRRYPLYSTWEAFFNQAALHLPILVIAASSTTGEAGQIMLAMYVLQLPLGLLGSAISQVYLSKAPEEYLRGNLASFTYNLVRHLIKVGAFPIIVIGSLSPVLFPLVFGASWERAGWLVVWMTPWFLLQFLASPVSMALNVVGAQRAAMVLQFFGLAVRLGMTYAATVFLKDSAAEMYALSGAVFYTVYLLSIFYYIRLSQLRTL